MWCNFGLAYAFTYNCNLNARFKLGTDDDWKQKYIKFTISSSDEENVRIFDHEIEKYYTPDMTTLTTKDKKFIYAISIPDYSGLESLIINKDDGYTQLVHLDGQMGATTLHFGYCK